jgi:transcriptional regulator with XRE-family HTH domain
MTAATAIRADYFSAAALQGQAVNDLSGNVSKSLQVDSSVLHAQHATEITVKSYNQSYRPFRERVREALRQRLHPNTNLHAKQLAYAIGISEATIWNLLSANNEPSGRVIDKLVEFFLDPFINEIWGCHNIICINRADARRADALRRMEEARAELEALEN